MLRGLIGMIHLAPLPGDPLYKGGGFAEVERRALADAEALAAGGADALLIENFGSVPFGRGALEPHTIAALGQIASRCLAFDLPVGVNCLRNDARSALGIAAAVGLGFVRVNVHTGAYVTDQGLIEGVADETLRYRERLGAEVKILADVLVKHATPLAPLTLHDATRDCLDRGLADSVIVTGSATGASIELTELQEVREACKERALFLGSGVTPGSTELAALADGAIVGTWLKQNGQVHAPVDPQRVRELVTALRGRFRRPNSQFPY